MMASVRCNVPGGSAPQSPLVVPVYGTAPEASNPFDDSGPKPNDVTAAIFLLLRTQDVTPEVFVCLQEPVTA